MERDSKEINGQHFLFPVGQKITGNSTKAFCGGDVYHFMFVPFESELNCPIGNVTYSPRSRNCWHAHPGLQVLLITGGRGWYQEEGKPARELKAGDYVIVQKGVKHWHGAAKDSWFTQLGLVMDCPKDSSVCYELVSDEEYDKLP